ncbi:serine/threonine protein kinase [bacterium]|nr:serine/threonine protein kinase [bacterium]
MSGYRDGDEPVPGYRLVTFLGRGSYGEVWKATGPGGTEAALKFIALDSRQGVKEFRAVGLVKRLRHPNLCPIQAIWLRDPAGNVMTDAPSGDPDESLTTRIKLGGPKELVIAMGLGDLNLAQQAENTRTSGGIPPRLLLRYMDGAARGIDYLNEPSHPPANSPIIHCDIKPANLLVVGGDVQVCDYGVARAIGSDAKKTLGAGTPAYAAPELIGNDPCPQTDQYSLAVTYFELRTGRLPFDEARALVANMTGALDLSALAPDERAVIARATSLRPELRYPTVQDMVEELKVACGVTLTRSAAIPQPAARRLPTPTPAPAPRPPEVAPPPPWASTEVWRTPVGPSETVPFPEVVRETPPPPRAEPATTTPWATDPALMPMGSPKRRRWVAPLAAGLVAVAVAVAGFVATRPDPSSPSTPPSTDPPQKYSSASQGSDKQSNPKADQVGSKATGKGRGPGSEKPSPKVDLPPPPPPLTIRLANHDLKTAADIDAAATIANELIPSTTQAEQDKIRDLVTQGLEDTAKTQQWRTNLTASGAYTAQELKEPREWSEAADRLAKSVGIPESAPVRGRIEDGKALVSLADAVLTKVPNRANLVDRYEAARAAAEQQRARGQLRHRFLYAPLVADPPAGGSGTQEKARAADLLVGASADLMSAPFWVDVPEYPAPRRKADADTLVDKAIGMSPVDTARAVTRHRQSFAAEELAQRFADLAEPLFYTSTVKNKLEPRLDKRRQDRKEAVALYGSALDLKPDHKSAAKWCAYLATMEGAPLPTPAGVEVKVDADHASRAFPLWQKAYLLALSETAAPDVAKFVLTAGVGGNRNPPKASDPKLYKTYSELFDGRADTVPAAERPRWQALASEARYMASDMTAADQETLSRARSAAEKDGLTEEAERMRQLLARESFDTELQRVIERGRK